METLRSFSPFELLASVAVLGLFLSLWIILYRDERQRSAARFEAWAATNGYTILSARIAVFPPLRALGCSGAGCFTASKFPMGKGASGVAMPSGLSCGYSGYSFQSSQ